MPASFALLAKRYGARPAEYGLNVYEVWPGIVASDDAERYDALIRDGLTQVDPWSTPKDAGRAVVAIAALGSACRLRQAAI